MTKIHAVLRSRTLMILFFLSLVLGASFYPGEQCRAGGGSSAERNNRMEVSVSYDHLSPNSSYGDWKNVSLSFYRKERPDLTWFTQVGGVSRQEGEGLLAAAGAYKDWNDSLYTFTSLSTGTNSQYLPEIRFDHDFNFKFGPAKQFVWVIGGTAAQYSGSQKDYILSTGLTAYLGKTVAGYRIFRNQSEPGSVTSHSQLFSLAYGEDKQQMTTATYSFGKQAYLATYLATPAAVNNDSRLVTLNHRRWLKEDYGVFGEISYLDLENSYRKTGFSIGFFREY